MQVPQLKIAVLHYQPQGEPEDPVVGNIAKALTEQGHKTEKISVHDRVFHLLEALAAQEPDLVFNVCETFADDYRLEVNVAALMEMARVKFTGSGTAGLLLAQDKVLTKQLLDYHEVLTPTFATFDGETFETNGRLKFPLIVKPARSDASIGIGRHSVVKDWDELTKRVQKIRKDLDDEALAEEFIEGREVYAGVIGPPTRPEILPIVELDFGSAWKEGEPKISDREVKFGTQTPTSPRLKIADLPAALTSRIERAALLAYKAVKVQDYARVDLRISAKGEPYVLEVNPNPYLEEVGELAMAAKESGVSYEALIAKIVESACVRYRIRAPSKGSSASNGDAA